MQDSTIWFLLAICGLGIMLLALAVFLFMSVLRFSGRGLLGIFSFLANSRIDKEPDPVQTATRPDLQRVANASAQGFDMALMQRQAGQAQIAPAATPPGFQPAPAAPVSVPVSAAVAPSPLAAYNAQVVNLNSVNAPQANLPLASSQPTVPTGSTPIPPGFQPAPGNLPIPLPNPLPNVPPNVPSQPNPANTYPAANNAVFYPPAAPGAPAPKPLIAPNTPAPNPYDAYDRDPASRRDPIFDYDDPNQVGGLANIDGGDDFGL